MEHVRVGPPLQPLHRVHRAHPPFGIGDHEAARAGTRASPGARAAIAARSISLARRPRQVAELVVRALGEDQVEVAQRDQQRERRPALPCCRSRPGRTGRSAAAGRGTPGGTSSASRPAAPRRRPTGRDRSRTGGGTRMRGAPPRAGSARPGCSPRGSRSSGRSGRARIRPAGRARCAATFWKRSAMALVVCTSIPSSCQYVQMSSSRHGPRPMRHRTERRHLESRVTEYVLDDGSHVAPAVLAEKRREHLLESGHLGWI